MLQNILWIRKELKKKKIEKFNDETKKNRILLQIKIEFNYEDGDK